MKKEYINNDAWRKIFPYLKSLKNIYAKQEPSCKNFVESIFWICRTGAQWRELPAQYGKSNSVFKRFNAWSKKGIWMNLHQFCIQDPDLEYICIDTTIVRAHACAAGYGDPEVEGLGRSKGGFSSKIHAKVDSLGNPLQFILTPGQRNDITQAKKFLKNIEGSHIICDKAYASNEFRGDIVKAGGIPEIPDKANCKEPWEYDKHIYKERHVIECFFSKIKHFRRVFSRFDKSARNFLSFLCFVGACIWLR